MQQRARLKVCLFPSCAILVRSSGLSRRPGAPWPMGGPVQAYIYDLRMMVLARFRRRLIVFSPPRSSAPLGSHLARNRLEPESQFGPRAPSTHHSQPWMPQRWKITKGKHLRTPRNSHFSLRDFCRVILLVQLVTIPN